MLAVGKAHKAARKRPKGKGAGRARNVLESDPFESRAGPGDADQNLERGHHASQRGRGLPRAQDVVDPAARALDPGLLRRLPACPIRSG